jgi:hypothetical protein
MCSKGCISVFIYSEAAKSKTRLKKGGKWRQLQKRSEVSSPRTVYVWALDRTFKKAASVVFGQPVPLSQQTSLMY